MKSNNYPLFSPIERIKIQNELGISMKVIQKWLVTPECYRKRIERAIERKVINPSPKDKQLLTTNEILQQLKITRQALHQQRKKGTFPPPHGNFGNRPRWTQTQINQYIKNSK